MVLRAGLHAVAYSRALDLSPGFARAQYNVGVQSLSYLRMFHSTHLFLAPSEKIFEVIRRAMQLSKHIRRMSQVNSIIFTR